MDLERELNDGERKLLDSLDQPTPRQEIEIMKPLPRRSADYYREGYPKHIQAIKEKEIDEEIRKLKESCKREKRQAKGSETFAIRTRISDKFEEIMVQRSLSEASLQSNFFADRLNSWSDRRSIILSYPYHRQIPRPKCVDGAYLCVDFLAAAYSEAWIRTFPRNDFDGEGAYVLLRRGSTARLCPATSSVDLRE